MAIDLFAPAIPARMAPAPEDDAMASAKLKDPPSPGLSAYDEDFYAWTLAQADALRDGRFAVLDLENLAEEIEDLGGEVFHKLRSSFRVILVHMLKWDHQPERRSRSWAGSIDLNRIRVADIVLRNPALRRRQEEAVAYAYREARVKAAVEMKRDKASLPATCPYGLDEILDRDFPWPTA